MGEAQELQPANINDQLINVEAKKSQENKNPADINKKTSCLRQYKWWLQMIIYAFFVLARESGGTLLGSSYFDNGGRSELMATLAQLMGFPILFPFQWIARPTKNDDHATEIANTTNKKPFGLNTKLASFYISIGTLAAAICMLYSIGLQYLPVSTYTIICASQLGFSAVLSYFLNKQKFTPYIVNYVVLLTVSSVLLVIHNDNDDSNKTSNKKHAIGLVCTLAASAGSALEYSLTQVAFQTVIKKETFRAIIDLALYKHMVATCIILTVLFASGGWKKLGSEMKEYKSGQVAYAMNLFWTAVSWQALGVGCAGLILKVSSLFSNAINILALSVPPILSVIFLNDKLTGLKVVAMWGFASYMYQEYVRDDEKERSDN